MTRATKAFGVEPGYAPYRLRQARYQALGEDIARFAQQLYQTEERRTDLLDVGVGKGVSRMYTEVQPGAEHVTYHAVDIYRHGAERVYKYDQWHHHKMDIENGLPDLDSNRFDAVICEQVLEHLHNAELTLGELARVLKPNGLMIVGVPIFPSGIHLIRKHVVPAVDGLFGRGPRCHVQAFSKRSFVKKVLENCDVDVVEIRGFRIASGGILRPLEHKRWWWRLNRILGTRVPGLCVEIQVVARKKTARQKKNEPGCLSSSRAA